MSLAKHLEEAAARMSEAAFRIDEARRKPSGAERTEEWLSALTDYATAASEIQQLGNESLHEKLHAIAGRLGLKDVL